MRDDYLRDEMVRQRRALEELTARKRGREDEHGVVILDSDEDEDVGERSNLKTIPTHTQDHGDT